MIELLIALGAGLISFLSPCVLPLIPGYISYISGSSLNELTAKKNINLIDARINSNFYSPILIGMAFAFGWTPCIGPILGSILVLASTEESINKGILLLTFYSLGLAIPFILSGYLIQKFLIFSKNFKKNINLVSKIGGIILLLTGILILTNQLQALGYYLLNFFPFLQNFG